MDLVLGTGGVFAHRDDGAEILGQALARRGPRLLAPHDPALRIDAYYILAAAGLLATANREAAIRLLRSEFDLAPR